MSGYSVLTPTPNIPEARRAEKIRELERRLDEVEGRVRSIPIVAGSPTQTAKNGSIVGDSTNNRLWLRVNGTWRYVALT